MTFLNLIILIVKFELQKILAKLVTIMNQTAQFLKVNHLNHQMLLQPINMLKILQLETLASHCVFFSKNWRPLSIKCFNRHIFVARSHVKLARQLVILNLSIKNFNHVIEQMHGKQVSIQLNNYLQQKEWASMIK